LIALWAIIAGVRRQQRTGVVLRRGRAPPSDGTCSIPSTSGTETHRVGSRSLTSVLSKISSGALGSVPQSLIVRSGLDRGQQGSRRGFSRAARAPSGAGGRVTEGQSSSVRRPRRRRRWREGSVRTGSGQSPAVWAKPADRGNGPPGQAARAGRLRPRGRSCRTGSRRLASGSRQSGALMTSSVSQTSWFHGLLDPSRRRSRGPARAEARLEGAVVDQQVDLQIDAARENLGRRKQCRSSNGRPDVLKPRGGVAGVNRPVRDGWSRG